MGPDSSSMPSQLLRVPISSEQHLSAREFSFLFLLLRCFFDSTVVERDLRQLLHEDEDFSSLITCVSVSLDAAENGMGLFGLL